MTISGNLDKQLTIIFNGDRATIDIYDPYMERHAIYSCWLADLARELQAAKDEAEKVGDLRIAVRKIAGILA